MTYEDTSLHTGRHARALEHNVHLANTVNLSDSLRSLLRNRQVLVDIFSPLHRYKVTRMSESVLRSKIQSSLINISDDDLLRALDFRNSRTQQAHRSCTKHYHSSIFGH